MVASPFTLAHGIGGAHLDLAVAALLIVAVLAAIRGRLFEGAALVGTAAAVKVTALVVDVAVVLAWAHVGGIARMGGTREGPGVSQPPP